MKFTFEINHPKHYYQFRELIKLLKSEGHTVHVFAFKKDIVLNLLDEENLGYEVIGKNRKGLFNKIIFSLFVLLKYYHIVYKLRPDVLISKASLISVLVARFIKKPSIIFPDSEVVILTNRLVAPLASIIVTPENFKLNYGNSHIRVNGFFEECYLAPPVFIPNKQIYKMLKIGEDESYAIIRFVGWNANHDLNHKGISNSEKIKLVLDLSKNTKVFITSEAVLPIELEKFRLNIPKNQIHSALYYASLYIGDSQTMATEAALLGTPSLRYNSFVGDNDMSNFIILEQTYQLLKNYNNFDSMYKDAILFSKDKTQKKEWVLKSQKFFSDKETINDEIYRIVTNVK